MHITSHHPSSIQSAHLNPKENGKENGTNLAKRRKVQIRRARRELSASSQISHDFYPSLTVHRKEAQRTV